MTKSRRVRHTDGRDQGSALIFALVLMIVGTMMVLPVMNYTMTVLRSNQTLSIKSQRVEAVKGGLRAALVNPAALYTACYPTGPSLSVQLAVPPALGIMSACTTTKQGTVAQPNDQRYALATTLVGSGAAIPAPYVNPDPVGQPELNDVMSPSWCTSMSVIPSIPCGKPYPNNGASDAIAWTVPAVYSLVSAASKIFAPQLPPFSNTLAFAGGYAMPLGDAGLACRVFFPGKYTDAVVITGSTPVYFVSGVYYFENAVYFSGDANVVVGAGVNPGCADSDSVAVADAIGAPFDAYSSGVGGTFVFGRNGRLVVSNATASVGGGVKVKFNRRLVDKSDPLAVLNDVSIMSVNGVYDPLTNSTGNLSLDLNADAVIDLYVPETLVFAAVPVDPATHFYKSSTLIPAALGSASCAPPPTVPAANCPIIDINVTASTAVTLTIPGYVAVPQGTISVVTGPGVSTAKDISFGGGILAAQMTVSADKPASLQIGLLNSVVQKTFKIVTETTGGSPHVVSTALVQVNETGGYAVNSWVVQTN